MAPIERVLVSSWRRGPRSTWIVHQLAAELAAGTLVVITGQLPLSPKGAPSPSVYCNHFF